MVNISGSVSSEQKAALIGLRNSILESPSADDLRLIYADLLDDTGNSLYADFIRKQIELHHLKCESPVDSVEEKPRTAYSKYCSNYSTCRHCYLTAETNRLIRQQTIYEPPDWVYGFTIQRGFLYQVTASLPSLLKYLPAYLKVHPIESVAASELQPRLYDKTSQWPTHCSWWRQFNRENPAALPLHVWNQLQDYHRFSTYDSTKDYLSKKEALVALSDAILRVAKNKNKQQDNRPE